MPIFDTKKQRAALVVMLLAVGLVIAMAPYASGLLGAPVLYVVFAPMHRWLARKIRPGPAAGVVILTAFLLIVLPGTWLIGMLVGQAQGVAQSLVKSPLLDRIATLRVGEFEVGPQIASIGKELIGWLGGSALGFIGTATRFTLNLLFSFFGLYYLLLNPAVTWKAIQPYIPFSEANVEILRERFRSVTTATIVGTGLTAAVQGAIVGLGFLLTGIGDPVFWGVVTMVFAILPVVGAGMVWGPAALSLLISGHPGRAILLVALGVVVVANVENLIRPYVFKRYSEIHPMVTLVGAVVGVSYFGLLGLLIGPLALSYFFELIRMYREEYLTT
ncbi:MAG TPA: AI-2E family transporter [Gemmatimonadales bacterium]|nr:AI-2E family transporter [Gemmatimonadales bacterium]